MAPSRRSSSLLNNCKEQLLITVQDAAIVSWPHGQKKPKTRQAFSTGAAGAMGGAFWGMLFGLIFFVPLLGLAIGAVIGGLTGKMTRLRHRRQASSTKSRAKSPKARPPSSCSPATCRGRPGRGRDEELAQVRDHLDQPVAPSRKPNCAPSSASPKLACLYRPFTGLDDW